MVPLTISFNNILYYLLKKKKVACNDVFDLLEENVISTKWI